MKRPNPICIHEAAHAVMAHCLGQRVDRLWWNGKADGKRGRGFTWVSSKSPSGRVVHWRKGDPIVFACFIMAGYMAEVEWCGWNPKTVPSSDWKALEARCITWRGRNTLKPTLKRWIRQEKAAIFIVAGALQSKGNLSRRQFLAALKTVARKK